MASTTRLLESQIRNLKLNSPQELQIHVGGGAFLSLNAEVLASKSSRIYTWMKDNKKDEISSFINDISSDVETIELVARFCNGFTINLSPENILKVACFAHYLGMTEDHSKQNLFTKSLHFIQNQVIPSWNKILRSLKAPEKIIQQAISIGLLDNLVESIILKALDYPRLLGEPIINSTSNQDNNDEVTERNMLKPEVSRRLFASDWHYEDLITLSSRLYEPIILAMIQRHVRVEYVSASIYKYAKKWALSKIDDEYDDVSDCPNNFKRERIEAVERMLPKDGGRGSLPCTLLCEMLYCAIALESSEVCRKGFEERIGKQLDQATIEDLFIPFQRYANKEERYDTECLRRILENFYYNYKVADSAGLITVAELFVGFLTEVASDIDLKITTFLKLAELSVASSSGVQENCDGIYEAVDIYLEKHSYLTMSEREQVCKVIDCNKLSQEALEHAAVNTKLPLRMVMQVLFIGQMNLRQTIGKDIQGCCDDDHRLLLQMEGGEEDVERGIHAEMAKMNNKVMELEQECNFMKREIQIANFKKTQGGKLNMWKEMKRKLGCITSSSKHDCNCQVKKKKVHPK